MSHNDNSGTLYFGGAVVAIIMLGFLIKILKSILLELSSLFTAFGKMAASFISMAWQLALIAGLIALAGFAIYAAWYFSLKYYRMVKQGTELREQVEARLSDTEYRLEESYSEFRRQVRLEVQQLKLELEQALKKSEVAPSAEPSDKSFQASESTAQPENELTTKNESSNLTIQEPTRPKDISNPF